MTTNNGHSAEELKKAVVSIQHCIIRDAHLIAIQRGVTEAEVIAEAKARILEL